MTNEFTHCFILKERLFSKHYFSIIFNLTLLIPANYFMESCTSGQFLGTLVDYSPSRYKTY